MYAPVFCCYKCLFVSAKFADEKNCSNFSGSGVTCNCLHPGMVKTNLGQYMRGDHTPFFQRMAFKMLWPVAMLTFDSPKKGAQTSIYCSIAPELDGVTGKYFS